MLYTKRNAIDPSDEFSISHYTVHHGLVNVDTRPKFYTGNRSIVDNHGLTPNYVQGVPYIETYDDGRPAVTVESDSVMLYKSLSFAPVGSIILCSNDLTNTATNPGVFIKSDHVGWHYTTRFELHGEQLVDVTERPDIREYVGIKYRRSWSRGDITNVCFSFYRVTGTNVVSLLQHLTAHLPIVSIGFGTNIWDEEPEWVIDANSVLETEIA